MNAKILNHLSEDFDKTWAELPENQRQKTIKFILGGIDLGMKYYTHFGDRLQDAYKTLLKIATPEIIKEKNTILRRMYTSPGMKKCFDENYELEVEITQKHNKGALIKDVLVTVCGLKTAKKVLSELESFVADVVDQPINQIDQKRFVINFTKIESLNKFNNQMLNIFKKEKQAVFEMFPEYVQTTEREM